MKCVFILMSIFLVGLDAFSQDITHRDIDSLLLTVSYKVDYYDYVSEDKKLTPDNMRNDVVFLQVGKNIAHSYSEQEKKRDMLAMRFAENNGKRTVDIWNLRAQLGEIYKNYPQKGEQTVIMNMQAAGMYKYVEVTPIIKWTIGQERKSVIGYQCLSATADYRGRSYKAWFCADIPLPYGPLWFGGLPGLIMEIYDSNGHYHFTCTGIEKSKGSETLTYWERNYISSTRKKCRALQTAFLHYPTQFFKDYGVTVHMDGEDLPPMPDNPIELK